MTDDDVEEITLKDAVTASFEAIEAEAKTEVEPAQPKEPKEATEPKSGTRDEKGRFRQKAEVAPETPESDTAVEETPAEENTDQGEEPTPEPAEQPLSAPERWSADWKAKFAALPRDAQQVLLEREGEYDKGFTQKSQEAADYKRRYEPIDRILTPRRQQFAMQGMTEEQGLTQLFALSDFATKDPVGFIRMFAQGRSLDLATLVQQPGQQAATPATPDFITPVLQRVNSLEQSIQQKEQAETNRMIDSFASAPGHEHFPEVREEMGVLLQHGIARDMEDAYQRACRANPAVWEKTQAAERTKAEEARKATEAKRIADQKAAAAKAIKAAGTQVSTKASFSGGAVAPLNMRESMLQTYDQLHGAA